MRERSAATYRAVLRRVGPLLTKKAPWEPRPTAIVCSPARPRRIPDEEVGLLFDDALEQPTANHASGRRWLLLTEASGAGLDGRWVATAWPVPMCSVTHTGAVVVRVGEPSPRRVVALHVCLGENILALARMAGERSLVGGHSVSKNRTAELTDRLVVPTGHPRVAPARAALHLVALAPRSRHPAPRALRGRRAQGHRGAE